MKIAKVVVTISLDKEFDYIIPNHMSDKVFVGSRVKVPFGRREIDGYVVAIGPLKEKPKFQLKEITRLTDDRPFVSEKILELARWIALYYCATVEQSIRAVLPGAIRKHSVKQKMKLFVSPIVNAQLPTKISEKQQLIIDSINASGGMFQSDLLEKLNITVSPIKTLEKKNVLKIEPKADRRDPLVNRRYIKSNPLKLMDSQKEALDILCEQIDNKNPKPVLLYGVTGSGKTEVYLQAISHVLTKGQGAIVLVPEISLTPQTVERFVSRFGKRIAVLHSHLSDGERFDEWHRIHKGEADIVIGARSAIFAPVKSLGLIVVDEEHEPSYKQDEAPRYNARDVAVVRGQMEGAAVCLGSATPALESWWNAKKDKYILATLPERVDSKKMPHIDIVDLKTEGKEPGQKTVFSRRLVDAMGDRLRKSEQTILFLNRRGFSTSLTCPSCGYVSECKDCSISHTYHRVTDELICHVCGDVKKVPAQCPECGSMDFKYAGIGTQRIEEIVKKIFPKARIQRMDADVTRKKTAYEDILGRFKAGDIDILIGTQMIAKGLHFPRVTLVGVIYADQSLNIPDFRSGERTYQLLSQVAGRAGRGDISGDVFIQTFNPFHPAIQMTRNTDFSGFCDLEIEFRRELLYPPFSRVICVTFKGESESVVSFCTTAFAEKLLEFFNNEHVMISDPIPAPLAKAKGLYRYQVMIRATKGLSLIKKTILEILSGFNLKGIDCIIDVDALSIR
jgi:primosomal protein N' (replication factor Y)